MATLEQFITETDRALPISVGTDVPDVDRYLPTAAVGEAISPQVQSFIEQTDQETTEPPPQERRGFRLGDTLPLAQEGFINSLLLLPEAIDAASNLVTGDDFSGADLLRQKAVEKSMIFSEKDKPKEGIITDALEIFGGSLAYGPALLRMGINIGVKTLPQARNFFQQALVNASRSPAAIAGSTALDASSSVGVASGKQVAEIVDAGPGGTLVLETLGGFANPFSLFNTLVRRGAPAAASGFRSLRDQLFPKSKAAVTRRAAKAVQKPFDDPRAAAASIDVESPIPAARQLNTEGSLKLEQKVLRSDPNLRQQYTDELNAAIDDAIIEARAIGELQDAGEVFARRGKQTINLMRIRAAQAAQEAEREIARLGPNADPADISDVVRSKVAAAKADGRVAETAAWDDVITEGKAGNKDIKQYVADELKQSSEEFADTTLIPGFVKRLVKKKKGLIVLDLKTVRTRVNALHDTAATAGDSNRARILNNISKAILKDMERADAGELTNAIKVSREFHQKFTQGGVGDLLARRSGGIPKIAPEDTLEAAFARKGTTQTLQQLIKGDPSIESNIKEFIRSNYLTNVVIDSGGNVTGLEAGHNRFLKRLRKSGTLKQFPGLEQELNQSFQAVRKDLNLKKRLKIVKERGGARLKFDSDKSIANEYLNGNGQIQLDSLVSSQNPITESRVLVRRMEGNPRAKQGLKAAFIDSLYDAAKDSAGKIDNLKLSRLLEKSTDTLKALGFTKQELARTERISEIIAASVLKPTGGAAGRMIDDGPAFLMDAAARFGAVQVPSRFLPLKGAGPGLQMANIASSKSKQVLADAFTDASEELLKTAHMDNELYQALLVTPTDTLKTQTQAAGVIRAWLPSLVAQDVSDN